ncbi:MarR family transcriptional regulator [Actinopolymorpha alba]|uniref:MarR family transcriptional regulator n=1 Tax=Actinopolymorpha alba TaxID=533267 RepID=UPI00039E5A20|nr:MarR family transcriptional regulator [Actinopolymorpha alba]
MSSRTGRREELKTAIAELGRDSSALGIVIHHAISQRFGLNPTDLKCLDVARHETNLTAGRLAELTGLSTSAITAVLDRLERAEFIERRRDPSDRRKVFVSSTGRRSVELASAYAPLSNGFGDLLDEYDDDQLELIADYARKLNVRAREIARQVTATTRPT